MYKLETIEREKYTDTVEGYTAIILLVSIKMTLRTCFYKRKKQISVTILFQTKSTKVGLEINVI